MTFSPASFSDGRRAIIVAVALLMLSIGLLWAVFSRPPDVLSFVLLLMALGLLAPVGYLAWRAWACLGLIYWIDRNAVTVAWGPLRQTIPLGQIQQVRRGGHVLSSPPQWQQRWPWLVKWLVYGPDLGATWPGNEGQIISLASRPLPEQLLLETSQGIFGISPANADAFLQALDEHHALGPTHLEALAQQRPRQAEAAIWQDRLGLGLLIAGFIGVLVLLGIVMASYPAGTAFLPRNAVPSSAFLIPAFAFAVWLLNGLWGLLVYGYQRVAALLLWSGALVVQLIAVVAVLAF